MLSCAPEQGVFHPCPGNPVHPKARLAFVHNVFLFFFNSQIAQFLRGNSQFAHLRGNSRPRTLDLARDVMQLHCTSSLMDGTIRQGFTPSCQTPTTRAAMTSLCASPKANLALRGVHHASTCALPVRNLRRALCEQNTLRRSRRVSHTRSRREPIQSESSYPANLLSVRGIGYIHRWRSRTGLHSRSRARGGLVRCTARTARLLR